jgi:hypothetical protein
MIESINGFQRLYPPEQPRHPGMRHDDINIPEIDLPAYVEALAHLPAGRNIAAAVERFSGERYWAGGIEFPQVKEKYIRVRIYFKKYVDDYRAFENDVSSLRLKAIKQEERFISQPSIQEESVISQESIARAKEIIKKREKVPLDIPPASK